MDTKKIMFALRQTNKLSQTQVATLAGISRTHYTNIENGIRKPSPKTSQRIAAVLKFDWRLFYED